MPIDEHRIKQINVRSEYFQDILDKVPSPILTLGNTIMLIIFLLIGVSLNFIKYPDLIITEVLVTTANPPIELHSRSSGRIIHLLKNDQEKIKAGEWIVVLNNDADYNNVLKVMASFKDVRPENFWTAVDTMQLDKSANLGDMQDIYSEYCKSVEELRLFRRLRSQSLQLDINSRREERLLILKKHQSDRLAVLERQYAISKKDYERYVLLDSTKAASSSELEQKEIVYLNMRSTLEGLKISLVDVQLQEEAIKKENLSLSTDQENTHFNLQRKVRQHYHTLIYRLTEWKNKYILEAPISGVLNFYEIRTTDQFLSAEQKVFTITPHITDDYFAIAKLPVANSGKVRVGQTCIIKLNNYPYNEFGFLKGDIQSISSAAQGGFYSLRIHLPSQLTTNLHKKLNCRSELIGQAEVIVDDLSLFERLFNSLISKTY